MAAVSAAIRLIVPTRDSEAFLPRLVESLQKQSLKPWRVSFIDASRGEACPARLTRLCQQDPRFDWRPQQPGSAGIYGAMNQGFSLAAPHEWLLFWGSDDWAAGPTVLEEAQACLEEAMAAGAPADLLVATGRYFHLKPATAPQAGRRTALRWRGSYRRSLLLGSTPPHQATLIGPGARRRLAAYRTTFQLAADLDYFLRLCRWPDLHVSRTPLELVHMGDGGISGQQTSRRLREVRQAYRESFGLLWPLPFLMRYGQRLLSRIEPRSERS